MLMSRRSQFFEFHQQRGIGSGLEVETGLALHAFLEGGRNAIGQRSAHIERHQVKACVRLAQLRRREEHGMPFMLRERGRNFCVEGILGRRIDLERQSSGEWRENGFQFQEGSS